MESHTCSICGKILASPQSLWNHKQRHSREDKSKNTALADMVTDSDSEDPRETDDATDMASSDTDDENHDWIWEKLVILSCYNDRYSSLDLFKTYIRFHIDSQNNSLFQSIMNDVTDGGSIQFAVKMNAESITDAVNSCSENDDSDDWFWCGLAEQRGELNCQWLDGEPCNCTEHNGISMLDTTSFFVKLFIDMEKDDLIEEIESDIKQKSREMSLNDAINQIVTNRKDEILSAFREARKTVDAFGIWKRNIFLQ